MATQRQEKVNRLIQKELAAILQEDSSKYLQGAFATITGVNMSPDLSVASIYISLLLTKKPQGVLDRLEENNKKIRLELGNRLRNQLRIVPHLRFFKDDTYEEAERIEKLLSTIVIPPAETEL
jgi:ribosome-binding factor A